MTNAVLPDRLSDHPFRYSFTICLKERVVCSLLGQRGLGRILDAGCGCGYFFSVLCRYFPGQSFEYTGIDVEQSAINAGRVYYASLRGVSLQCGDIISLSFPSDEFDNAIFLDAIEHVVNPKAALSEIFRVLKPGGALVISTPNSLAPLTDTFFCEYLHDTAHMSNQRPGYLPSELCTELSEVGFEVESVRTTNMFVSELLITLTKLGFRIKRTRYSSQADVLELSSSLLFKLHKFVFFPIGYWICRIEELLLNQFVNGHCLVVKATKPNVRN